MTDKIWKVLVTGGAGCVGSALVPALLKAGHQVNVLDLYGEDLFAEYRDSGRLTEIKGDQIFILTIWSICIYSFCNAMMKKLTLKLL